MDQLDLHLKIREKIQKGDFVEIFELVSEKPIAEDNEDVKECSHKQHKPKVEKMLINWIKGFSI